jgi:1-acyl-sn-glycerol-3-phosphate acyltransferase
MSLLKFPYSIKTRSAQLNSYIVRIGMRLILWVRCEVHGKENISKTPSIYVVKHQSEWETLYLQTLITRSCFVTKKELLDIPLLGSGLKALEYIPVDRSAGIKSLKEVMNAGKNRLSRNINIVIFPEGTRVAPKDSPKFHKSAMLLAKATQSSVIPIAHNSGSIWPASTKKQLILPGTIKVIIGEPIKNTGNIDELTESSYIWIKNKMQEIE